MIAETLFKGCICVNMNYCNTSFFDACAIHLFIISSSTPSFAREISDSSAICCKKDSDRSEKFQIQAPPIGRGIQIQPVGNDSTQAQKVKNQQQKIWWSTNQSIKKLNRHVFSISKPMCLYISFLYDEEWNIFIVCIHRYIHTSVYYYFFGSRHCSSPGVSIIIIILSIVSS